MLAENFRTAAELGLVDTERAALVTVLRMLDRGELVHDRDFRQIHGGFNMQLFDCGTTHCIIGYARCFSGQASFRSLRPVGVLRRKRGIDRLCFPGTGDARKITVSQAAIALRNYLTTGEPCWKEALAA